MLTSDMGLVVVTIQTAATATLEPRSSSPFDRNFFQGFNPEPNLIPLDLQDGFRGSFVNDDAFAGFSGENEHLQSSLIYTTVATVSTMTIGGPAGRRTATLICARITTIGHTTCVSTFVRAC